MLLIYLRSHPQMKKYELLDDAIFYSHNFRFHSFTAGQLLQAGDTKSSGSSGNQEEKENPVLQNQASWTWILNCYNYCLLTICLIKIDKGLFFFKKMGHSRPLFLFSSFQYSWQNTNLPYKSLPMTVYEPQNSGVVSNRSTNWATTTAQPVSILTNPTGTIVLPKAIFKYILWWHLNL